MSLPTLSDVHVDTPLTNMSVAILQSTENFVASKVFPTVPSPKQSDRYYTYDRGDFNRSQAKKRAPSTESAGAGYNLDNTPSFFCDVWGIHRDVSWQVDANADAVLNLEVEAQTFVTHQLLIAKEVDWVSNYFTGGLWTGGDVDGVSGSPGSGEVRQWSDTTNGNPISDIRLAKTSILESTGFMPNTLVITQPVMDALEDHPDIVDRIKYSGAVGPGSPARVNEQTLAQLFGLDRVVVSRAIRNTAAENLTDSHSFIGGKKALLVYTPPAPGRMTAAAGYTFTWQGYLGTANEFGLAITRFDIREKKATRIEGEMAFAHKLVASDLGYFWDTIVA